MTGPPADGEPGTTESPPTAEDAVEAPHAAEDAPDEAPPADPDATEAAAGAPPADPSTTEAPPADPDADPGTTEAPPADPHAAIDAPDEAVATAETPAAGEAAPDAPAQLRQDDEEPAPPPAPPPLPPDVEPPAAPPLPRRRTLVDVTAAVLTVLVTLTFLMYLLVEPTQPWIALLGAVVAALGTDGVLRAARYRAIDLGLDPTQQIVLPALYALAVPLFIEDTFRGFWVLAGGLVAGLGFGAALVAQVHSTRAYEEWLEFARPVASAAVYVTAFALFSLTYVFGLALVPALAAVALASGLLAIELLRDGHADPPDTLAFAGVVALVVTQLRWALHYVPLDGHLAALALLLGFFLTSGVLHAHLTLQLRRTVVAEYVAIAALGGALIVGASTAGLA